MSVRVGVDTGGTFTDVVAFDTESGMLAVAKVPSRPAAPETAFWAGIDSLPAELHARVSALAHGTTIATNSLLERSGVKIGLLTTAGFEDVLTIGREGRTEMYRLDFEPEVPLFLCSRASTIGLQERIGADGRGLRGLDRAEVERALDALVEDQHIEVLAICLMFSFANAQHENEILQIAAERYPDLPAFASSVVSPRYREYERLVSTLFSAYVGPLVSEYFAGIEAEAGAREIASPLQVMQSIGGLTSLDAVARRPALTVLSGPAAGVAAVAALARQTGRSKVISMDLGGTSNDVAVVVDGQPETLNEGLVGRYPLSVPMLSVHTIGAGGGSIARIDAGGSLRVGPISAGSMPGPACYGRGGTRPTVTDASLVLGYLRAEGFGSTGTSLDPGLAHDVVEREVGTPAGLSPLEAAWGIHSVLVNEIADQLRLKTVDVGLDPREFSLVSFGGSGPIVAARLIPVLGLSEVIVPPMPGVLSAIGLLLARQEHEEELSLPSAGRGIIPADHLNTALRELGLACDGAWARITAEPPTTEAYLIDLRYRGQSHEIRCPIEVVAGAARSEAIAEAYEWFHERHQALFGHSDRSYPVEAMTIRVRRERVMDSVPAPVAATETGAVMPEPVSSRVCFFGPDGTFDTPVYTRDQFVPGSTARGPAIVDQMDTTVVIYPDQRVQTDQLGNLVITTIDADASADP